ncbi:helix-turn-helix domain-containing protein [Pedobacter sp.]|uniref:helix-turn-helix domain-containing protein n=1 Tax=Pedobacter sp. TaxID=1411316 RepID=UPI003C67EC6A
MKKDKEVIPVLQSKGFVSGTGIMHFDTENLSERLTQVGRFHRSNHYICLLLGTGEATFSLAQRTFKVVKDDLFLIRHGEIHRLSAIENVRGWMIFFDHISMSEGDVYALDEFIERSPLLHLKVEESAWFLSLFELMATSNGDHSALNVETTIIGHLFTSALYKIFCIYQASKMLLKYSRSPRNILITRQFNHILRQQFKAYRFPIDYARAMNISLGYLNDTVRAVSGKTVSACIQQELIIEAKHLLSRSELSIKEVAVNLGFKDPKYFHKIFLRHTGQSPGAFRKSNDDEPE